MRITDSVYMLSGSAYGQVGNVYAIASDHKLILIDTGENNSALDIILENIKYYGLEDMPVTHVLITHMHIDHAGNAWYFRDRGAVIASSRSDASGIEEGGERVNDFCRKSFQTCTVDQFIADGEVLRINGVEIEAFLMPGHTEGSLFFRFCMDGKSFLCTGDTVVPAEGGDYGGNFKAKLGWMGSLELDKAKYIASLRKACSIKADVLLAGHGIPVMKNGSDVIGSALIKALETFR